MQNILTRSITLNLKSYFSAGLLRGFTHKYTVSPGNKRIVIFSNISFFILSFQQGQPCMHSLIHYFPVLTNKEVLVEAKIYQYIKVRPILFLK